MKDNMEVPQKIRDLPYGTMILLVDPYPREWNIGDVEEIFAYMFIVILFTLDKSQMQLKCSPNMNRKTKGYIC